MLRYRIILAVAVITLLMGCGRNTPMTPTDMLELPPDVLSSTAKDAAAAASDKPLPEVKTEDKAEVNDNKKDGGNQERGVYLRIRENFDKAWQDTDTALAQQKGFNVSADKNAGIFTVDYPHANRGEEPGLLERLVLGRKGSADYRYQIRLTKVDDKTTELAVLNHKGKWEDTPEARDIVERIKTALNN